MATRPPRDEGEYPAGYQSVYDVPGPKGGGAGGGYGFQGVPASASTAEDIAADADPEVGVPLKAASKVIPLRPPGKGKPAPSKTSKGPVTKSGLGKAGRNVGSGAMSLTPALPSALGGGKGGSSPLGKLFSAVIAGWAVLEIGALLTGQKFSLQLLGRNKPGTLNAGQLTSYNAAAAAPTPFVPVYAGQAADLARITGAAPNAGAPAAVTPLFHATGIPAGSVA